jgi:hypothetical protein
VMVPLVRRICPASSRYNYLNGISGDEPSLGPSASGCHRFIGTATGAMARMFAAWSWVRRSKQPAAYARKVLLNRRLLERPSPGGLPRQASRVIAAGTARWSHPDRKMTPGKAGGSQSPACIGQSGPAATRVATRSASISSISAADATPPCWKRACQTWALWRDTPSSWATSAWVRPWANNSADCSRRASRAARSWAGSGRRVVGIAGRSHTTSPAVNPTHETQ